MVDMTGIKFDKDGLIPAIVVDFESGAVLMMAYMNEESLRISICEGRTCFWSRSRNQLWRKGETSGNVQHIVSIKADCDRDTLLVTVRQTGPACHTGAMSCFYETLHDACDTQNEQFSLSTLHDVIKGRKASRKPGSYTTYLFEKGLDKILKKFGEEATEVIIAAKSDDKAETVYELSDLVYHALVLMTEVGISLDDIKNELKSRRIGDSEETS